ncbi:hypothetical protein M8A51_24285 [Schlegelella sp. S2-27]|uniref:Uncharacterized protein n=1 Tax=Caldimonas mangrovi TaxID=2944811 RepID=A0ABT0YV87_9BURK|nr:hypothetical protein [Caldimonas mangrovi]MCM5682662.1 hypothetical protein [Caldimonas mangrovi]
MWFAKLKARLVPRATPPRSGHQAGSPAVAAAVALLAKLRPEWSTPTGYRYAYTSVDGRYVALLCDRYTCQVVDLQASRYLHGPDASPRGFEGTR